MTVDRRTFLKILGSSFTVGGASIAAYLKTTPPPEVQYSGTTILMRRDTVSIRIEGGEGVEGVWSAEVHGPDHQVLLEHDFGFCSLTDGGELVWTLDPSPNWKPGMYTLVVKLVRTSDYQVVSRTIRFEVA